MVERAPVLDGLALALLIAGVVVMLTPLYLIVTAASATPEVIAREGLPAWPGTHLLSNLHTVWSTTPLPVQIWNSLLVALLVVAGKMAFAMLTAFAIVFFRSPCRHLIFWAVLVTLMLPLEVRIVPSYAVAANVLAPVQAFLEATGLSDLVAILTGIEVRLAWNLIDTYWGLSLPLIATATGTFLFRQFFRTVPPQLVEAARMDGAGPIRFFFEILLPLSKTTMAALATLVFIGTWNQFLWPLLVTTDETMRTAVVGLANMQAASLDELPEWHLTMAAALIVMLPPLIVIALLQRWFVKGLMAGHH